MLDGISNANDYIDLHETIVELINNFAQNIKEAARNEEYRI